MPVATRFGRLVVLLAGTVLAGCAGLGPQPGAPSLEATHGAGTPGWQRIRFFTVWPAGEDPNWYVDALLAHQVVGPVLRRHRDEIALWRFHRRANRDAAGHSLSFLSYASAATNDAVCAEVRSAPLVRQLVQERVLETLVCAPNGTRIEATSDPSWPPEIQRSWPYFIMGVSETWLGLIDGYGQQAPPKDPADLEETLERFRAIEDAVSAAWAEEGGHAYLHHLNAVFGYRPVYIHERRLQRF
jgi:hypothetical protein